MPILKDDEEYKKKKKEHSVNHKVLCSHMTLLIRKLSRIFGFFKTILAFLFGNKF